MDLVDKDNILHLQSSSIFDTLLVLPYTICHHPHGLDGSGDRAVCMNPEGCDSGVLLLPPNLLSG